MRKQAFKIQRYRRKYHRNSINIVSNRSEEHAIKHTHCSFQMIQDLWLTYQVTETKNVRE